MQNRESSIYDPIQNISERFEQLICDLKETYPPEYSDEISIQRELNNRDDQITALQQRMFTVFIQKALMLYNQSNLSWHKSKTSTQLKKILSNDQIPLEEKLQAISEYTANSRNIGRNLYKSLQQSEALILNALCINFDKLAKPNYYKTL